jgi:serine/threonine protein kinase
VIEDSRYHRREKEILEALCMGDQARNPHVICVFTTLVWQSNEQNVGKIGIVMELCEGTLDSLLDEIKGTNSRTKTHQIFSVAVQILEGLVYCHSQNYTHRDVNPRNGVSP